MKTLSFWKKSLYSALIFFGTLIILSIGYAAWNTTMSPVSSGDSLTMGKWNALVNNISDVNTRLSNIEASGSLGVGQTWQNVTTSRVSGTTYTNTTGKPIAISVQTTGAMSAALSLSATINSIQTHYDYKPAISGAQYASSVFLIVPNGITYTVAYNSTINLVWAELR